MRCLSPLSAEEDSSRLFSPLRLTVSWQGIRYNERGAPPVGGDRRVHCLEVRVALPPAMSVGGPSPPGTSQQGDGQPTLTALLFTVANCPVCRRPSKQTERYFAGSPLSPLRSSVPCPSYEGPSPALCCVFLLGASVLSQRQRRRPQAKQPGLLPASCYWPIQYPSAVSPGMPVDSFP